MLPLEKIDQDAETLWNYQRLDQKQKVSDCIIVLGGHDTRVAERGAELILNKLAPVMIISGGFGYYTKSIWKETEAELFEKVAINMGVSPRLIIKEPKASNTGENIEFTQKIIKEKKIKIETAIVVQKPYMERRTWATFKKLWPGLDISVTSPQIRFSEYCNEAISKKRLYNALVGQLQRIMNYPDKEFSIKQNVPEQVIRAYKNLIEFGYTENMTDI